MRTNLKDLTGACKECEGLERKKRGAGGALCASPVTSLILLLKLLLFYRHVAFLTVGTDAFRDIALGFLCRSHLFPFPIPHPSSLPSLSLSFVADGQQWESNAFRGREAEGGRGTAGETHRHTHTEPHT